jgi:hypothetical protein
MEQKYIKEFEELIDRVTNNSWYTTDIKSVLGDRYRQHSQWDDAIDLMDSLIKLFEKNKVKYVIVGGFAVNFYGYDRMTQDIDLLVVPSKENVQWNTAFKSNI